jgi:hypothetical protein
MEPFTSHRAAGSTRVAALFLVRVFRPPTKPPPSQAISAGMFPIFTFRQPFDLAETAAEI